MSKDPLQLVDDKPWYKDGLKFKCTECGKCCTGSPGYTWVSLDEICKIADHLQMERNAFVKKYLRKVDGKWALLEKPTNYDCIFLDGKKCSIYSVRPMQCRTFPWWIENLHTKKDWEEAAIDCEGISEDAPVIPFEEINAVAQLQQEYDLLEHE